MITSFSVSKILKSPLFHLFEKYGLHLFQKFLDSVFSSIFLKYSFLNCLFNLVAKFTFFIIFLSLDNWILSALFFKRERVIIAKLKVLDTFGFWLLLKFFVFLGASLWKTLTKLSLKAAYSLLLTSTARKNKVFHSGFLL